MLNRHCYAALTNPRECEQPQSSFTRISAHSSIRGAIVYRCADYPNDAGSVHAATGARAKCVFTHNLRLITFHEEHARQRIAMEIKTYPLASLSPSLQGYIRAHKHERREGQWTHEGSAGRARKHAAVAFMYTGSSSSIRACTSGNHRAAASQ